MSPVTVTRPRRFRAGLWESSDAPREVGKLALADVNSITATFLAGTANAGAGLAA